MTGLWWLTFYDSLHVMVFAVIALTVFVGIQAFTSRSHVQNAVIAGITTIFFGFVSEAAQIPGPRDASLGDLLSDAAGATGTLLLLLAAGSSTTMTSRSRVALSISGTSILLAALFPFISVSAAYIERNHNEPILFSFDSSFSRKFVRMQNARLEVFDQSPGSRKAGQISLNKGAWPGIIFHDIWPDWRPYSTLIIDLGLAGEPSLEVNIRVNDRLHKLGNQPRNDRFNKTISLHPGRQTLRISLDEIQYAPKERRMDLSQIEGIVIFCSSAYAGRHFELLEIRLE